VGAQRSWTLQTRFSADAEKDFSVAPEMLARLNAAVGRELLALEKQAQQTVEAATVVGVHGGKLDGHSLGRGDPADHPSSADCTDSGREYEFNETLLRGRIRSADKKPA
jgi:hypothetical protein